MSITPRGMSVQEAYRLYRDGGLFVNRRYQRKLVWTEEEKAKLIDSALKGFPIPLILLAERPTIHGIGKYEIMDGMQRLNAIFSFIENGFPIDGKYFDLSEFARAKQIAEAGLFDSVDDGTPLLSPQECADLLDYQLAVTIYPATEEDEITEVFGRINSGGRQLSPQERRQAGVITPFADMVRNISSELRGDASEEILFLFDMPEISIDSKRHAQGYGLEAEDTFWCKQGILWVSQLRDSEDEDMVADIAASILLDEPLARSRERLDELYSRDSSLSEDIERALTVYGLERISEEIKVTFSVLRETIEACSSEQNYLRSVVNPGSKNPIKASFYAIFMAFYNLVIQQECSPDDPPGIMGALRNHQQDMRSSAHYTLSADRTANIDKTIGLIQKFFVKKEPPLLRHGPGLAIDFENSLRRSRIETTRYEFKQGLLRLSPGREFDNHLLPRLIETMCGIANLGPDSKGYLFIGVADKKSDAERIKELYGIEPINVNERYVVGIDREVTQLNITIDEYIDKILGAIRTSDLSDPLKTQVLTHIDTVEYKGFSVIRVTMPTQSNVCFVGDDVFIREASSTIKVSGRKLLAVNEVFQNHATSS